MKNINELYTADPFVLYDEKSGYYYCFGTYHLKDKHAFKIFKSKDKDNWEFVNYALDLQHENIWGKDWFWAPECYYNPNNGFYYLFYSARVKDELTEKYFHDPNYVESCKLGVAVSKNVEGPYVNITNEPMDFSPFDFEYIDVDGVSNIFELTTDDVIKSSPVGNYIPAIDVNLLIEDNRIVLYFSRCCYKNCRFDYEYNRFIEASEVACVELDTKWWFDPFAQTMPQIKNEYITYDSNHRRCDKFITLINYRDEPQKWENQHISDYFIYDKNRKNRRWSEGSTIFKMRLNGKMVYAITYSCNCYMDKDYAVGIAFSENPLGPFKKYENNPIIFEQENVCSTGHGSIVFEGNEVYYFLHGRLDVARDRILCYTKIKEDQGNVSSEKITVCNLI